jgi:serine/threonine protein kinase
VNDSKAVQHDQLAQTFEPVEAGVDCELKTRGRYQICMELASGGMGTVYLALYRGVDGFERVVALKRMHPELAQEAHFVEMFFDEAQALARVQHPNVCALLDLGTLDDSYFLAMDFLEGEPLSSVYSALATSPAMQGGDRLPYLIARIFARLSDGLQAVHQTCDERGNLLNLVHCDISPHNLFVLYDGTVRLMDFGAARAKRGMLHQEKPGIARGKLPYMAPEQLDGADPDPRFDIWSIGVSMWELLTGESLFEGRSMKAIVAEVKSKKIQLASEINPGVPVALAQIVDRTLTRDQGARLSSARELSAELEAFLSDAGECVPAAEIATWLEALFGRQANERHKMRARARAIGDHLMPPSVRPFGELHSNSPDEPAANTGATIEVNLPAFTKTQQLVVEGIPKAASVIPERMPEPQPRRSQTVTVALGAAAVLLLAATTGLLLAPPARLLSPAAHVARAPNVAPRVTQTPVTMLPPSAAEPAAHKAEAGAAAQQTVERAHVPDEAPAPAASIIPEATTVVEPAAPATAPGVVVADAPANAAPPTAATSPADAPVNAAPPTAASSPAPPTPAPAPAIPAAAALLADNKPAQPAATTRETQPKPAARPRPTRTSAPAPVQYVAGGSVLVVAKPGSAYVIWQGRLLGKTPVRVRLPVGNHKLLLRPTAGGPDVNFEVHMEDGWSSVADVKLQP